MKKRGVEAKEKNGLAGQSSSYRGTRQAARQQTGGVRGAKCSVGQTECQTHFEIMGQERSREREGADKGRKQARGGMWEGNSRAQNIEREELRGLLGRGLAVRVYVCFLGRKRGCVCAVVRALRSCACPEKGSREGVRVSLGRERASVWAGACLCVSCVFVCVAA